jgi:hypothetical protein
LRGVFLWLILQPASRYTCAATGRQVRPGKKGKGMMRWIVLAGVLAAWLGTTAVSYAADLDGYKPVPINNGPNTLHLAGHEVLAFRAWRENYNAHGFDVVTLYMRGKGGQGQDLWNLLPAFDETGGNMKEHDHLAVSGGADCELEDFRLLVSPDGKSAELIVANRDMGESYADAAAVHFSYYRLAENADGTVGWPPFYFELQKTVTPKKTYCDVDEAFDKELHLGASSGKGGPGAE